MQARAADVSNMLANLQASMPRPAPWRWRTRATARSSVPGTSAPALRVSCSAASSSPRFRQATSSCNLCSAASAAAARSSAAPSASSWRSSCRQAGLNRGLSRCGCCVRRQVQHVPH